MSITVHEICGRTHGYGPKSGDGAALEATIDTPTCAIIDDKGDIWIAEKKQHKIRKYLHDKQQVVTVIGNGSPDFADGSFADARLNSPTYLAFDLNGDILFTDTGNNVIRKIVLKENKVITIAGMPCRQGHLDETFHRAIFDCPWGIAVDHAGNIWVTDSAQCCIRKLDVKTNNVETIAGTVGEPIDLENSGSETAASKVGLRAPRGLKVDSAGNIIFADEQSNKIKKLVVASNTITTVAGTRAETNFGSFEDGPSLQAKFSWPKDIDVDPHGNIYVADTENKRIRKISISGEVTTIVSGHAHLRSPCSMTFLKGELIVSDVTENKIFRVSGF